MNTLQTRALAATLSAAALALAACTGQSNYDDRTVSFARLSMAQAYTLDGTARTFGTNSDLIYLDSVSMLIPTIVGHNDIRSLQDSIFSAAFDTVGVDHKAIVQKYFAKDASDTGFNAVATSTDSINIHTADGFDIVSGSVTNLTSDLIVYRVTNDSYAPRAAHGSTTMRYINYSIADGSIITLDDIFTPDGLRQLPEVIAKRADNLSAVFGPTTVTALPSGNNFYISPSDEIVFVYQQYEVASYAQGIINVPFYPYELSSYMTAGGLKLFGLVDFIQQ